MDVTASYQIAKPDLLGMDDFSWVVLGCSKGLQQTTFQPVCRCWTLVLVGDRFSEYTIWWLHLERLGGGFHSTGAYFGGRLCTQ